MHRAKTGSRRLEQGSVSGSVLGVFIFLFGLALILFTFKLAYDLFLKAPEDSLGIKHGQPLDLAQAGQALVGQVIRVLLLIVMGLMGSLIANKGVSMFAGSRPQTTVVKEKKPTSQPDSE